MLQWSWRTLLWGIGLQFLFGLLILRTTIGLGGMQWLGKQVEVLRYTHTDRHVHTHTHAYTHAHTSFLSSLLYFRIWSQHKNFLLFQIISFSFFSSDTFRNIPFASRLDLKNVDDLIVLCTNDTVCCLKFCHPVTNNSKCSPYRFLCHLQILGLSLFLVPVTQTTFSLSRYDAHSFMCTHTQTHTQTHRSANSKIKNKYNNQLYSSKFKWRS